MDFSQLVKDFISLLDNTPGVEKTPKLLQIGFTCISKATIPEEIKQIAKSWYPLFFNLLRLFLHYKTHFSKIFNDQYNSKKGHIFALNKFETKNCLNIDHIYYKLKDNQP